MRNNCVRISHDVARHIGALFIRLHNNLLLIDKMDMYASELIENARGIKEQAFTNFLESSVSSDSEYLYYDIGVYDEIMDDLCTIRNGFAPYYRDDTVADIFGIIDSIRASFNDNERRFM